MKKRSCCFFFFGLLLASSFKCVKLWTWDTNFLTVEQYSENKHFLLEVFQNQDFLFLQNFKGEEVLDQIIKDLNKQSGNSWKKELSDLKKDAFFYKNKTLDINVFSFQEKRNQIVAMVKILSTNEKFFIIGLRSKNKKGSTYNELKKFFKDYDQFKKSVTTKDLKIIEKNTLILGNLKADCGYLNQTEYKKLEQQIFLDYKFMFLIDENTVVEKNCALERVISTLKFKDKAIKTIEVNNLIKELNLTEKEAINIINYPLKLSLNEEFETNSWDIQQVYIILMISLPVISIVILILVIIALILVFIPLFSKKWKKKDEILKDDSFDKYRESIKRLTKHLIQDDLLRKISQEENIDDVFAEESENDSSNEMKIETYIINSESEKKKKCKIM